VARRPSTIRFRITALAVIAVAGILVGAGTALVTVHQRQLVSALDASLAQRASDLEILIVSDDEIPPMVAGHESGFAQLVSEAGSVVASTDNISGAAALPAGPPGDIDELRTLVGVGPDPGEYRVLSRLITTPTGPGTLIVGASLADIARSTAALSALLLVAIPIAVAILAVVVWLVVGRTLAPVERIRSQVAAIGAGRLDQRVPVPGGDDEVSRLARTMNEMLDRLESSAERQRRFVADASHELRTPLTRMRAELEVITGSGAPIAHGPVRDSLLEELVSMQHLVEDLLVLARSDAAEDVGREEPVDLDDIVLREAQGLRATAAIRADVSGVSAAHVLGDPGQLARAVRNLLDNAARHAATTIILSLAETDGEVVFAVADDGPGIPDDLRERIFERFERIDKARTRSAGGTGLGLAIARAIVVRHRGTLVVDPAYRAGARFLMRIPAAEGRAQSWP
jgi:signal transduction histidine kinase